ncbi:MAG: hypothetical protein WDZ82_02725 [Candidatus Paceibacterota bacterium]
MPSNVPELLDKINATILNPLILLMFTVATVLFAWGVITFITSEEGGEARQQGKTNLVYGLLGLFIMIAVYGIIRIIGATFGIPIADLYIF